MTATPDPAPVHLLVRIWLPDRPGALGLVASRIGAVRADIAMIDVLERGNTVAVDEFAVTLADDALVPMLIREIEEVEGAWVEEVRPVETFPDARLDAIESAARLCESADVGDLHESLVVHVLREMLGEWSALIGPELEVRAGPSPERPVLEALAIGMQASPVVARGETGPEDLAGAALPDHDAVLLVGRDGHPFRRRERAQLLALARVADRVWTLLAQG